MTIKRTDAIHQLIPNTEWHLVGETLTIFTPNVETPTMAQIDAKVLQLNEQFEQEKIAQAEQKLALLEKLGITENEAKLLLL
jgi:hypothetical protein